MRRNAGMIAMMTTTRMPNVWGQGALFVHSGLDGQNLWADDFAGYLSGDRLGIQFHTEPKMELYFAFEGVSNIEHHAVASDYLCATLTKWDGQQGVMQTAFAQQHVIVGQSPYFAQPGVNAHVPAEHSQIGSAQVYGCKETYCALCVELADGMYRFALAYAHDKMAAASLAQEALCMDMDAVFARKTAYFANLPQLNAPEFEQRLFLKCCSIMKGQFYSAEAPFSGLWTTPDRLPHRHLWLWDSVFHSLGNRHISASVSRRTLDAVLETIAPDGFMPITTTPKGSAEGVTQPPLLAWGYLHHYRATGDLSALKEAYPKLKAYLLWNKRNRDSNGNDLFEWLIEEDGNCRCGECGMDNSPRFDIAEPMESIDFTCYMANDVRTMVQIAKAIGLEEDVPMWQSWYASIRQAVNDHLWDEEDGLYYDKLVADQRFHKVKAVSSFLPLFAGIADEKQAARLVEALEDPDQFGTPFGIPSIAKTDATFGTDMWRGPVWINFNYMIAEGLRAYEYGELADRLIERTIEVMGFWYSQEGVIYEFYDSCDRRSPSTLNRKGPAVKPYLFDVRYTTIRDYGWSATLLADMLAQRYPAK